MNKSLTQEIVGAMCSSSDEIFNRAKELAIKNNLQSKRRGWKTQGSERNGVDVVIKYNMYSMEILIKRKGKVIDAIIVKGNTSHDDATYGCGLRWMAKP